MAIAGIIITLLGFLISVFSLGATSSTMGRLVVVLIGLAVSLVCIIGVLNRAYMKTPSEKITMKITRLLIVLLCLASVGLAQTPPAAAPPRST
jgi:hypothetical protein